MYLYKREGLGQPTTSQPSLIPYSPPFPNIHAKKPDLYDAALRAEEAAEKLKWFKDVYLKLADATSSAHLALDKADQVIVIPAEKSVENLLGPKLVKAALKQSGKSLAKHLVGEDFGRILGILDFLWKLKTALELAEGRRLVNEQNKSRYTEAYRYKLRFFIRLLIAQIAPGADPVKLASLMWNAYWAYRKAQNELWKYQDIEKNLKEGLQPYQRRAPTINPR
jgi:hypothetical protein